MSVHAGFTGHRCGNGDSFNSYIKESWDRCVDLGISQNHIPRPTKVDNGDIIALRGEYSVLLEIVKPYIKRIGFLLPIENLVIELYTKDAILIYREENVAGFVINHQDFGDIITEEEYGNTALNISLRHSIPIALFGEQHFLNVLKRWASFAVPIKDLSGSLIAVLGIAVPIKHADRNILNVMMVAASAIENEIVLFDEQNILTATNKAMRELNSIVIKMASMLSHEIRNSLSTISAYVQLLQLQEVLDNKKGDKLIGEVGKINEMLNRFKSLDQSTEPRLYKKSIRDLLIDVVHSLKPRANLSNISIGLEIPDRDIVTMLDTNLMESVFVNIIINSIQAIGDSGGKIKIQCGVEDREGKIHIIFEDTGPGIAEDKLSDVFNLFYTTKKEGSGLGLAMCQHIVKAHGGKILVESVEGYGTKFIVILPCINRATIE